jgi:glycosyltransferase involved in cell wall biosynthesis
MAVCFGTVVYPAAMKYFGEFIASISAQTTKDFILLVICDGLNGSELARIKSCMEKVPVESLMIEGMRNSTPIQLRVQLLEEAKKREFDILILGDADDTFAENRVEKVMDVFDGSPEKTFVYNELRYCDGASCMPKLPESVTDVLQILDYNFLGLSNTALRISYLDIDEIRSFNECTSYVFDWYLYSRLVLSYHKGGLAKGTFTYYRMHDNNFVGISQASGETIDKEIDIKIKHYSTLAKYSPVFEKLADAYNVRNIVTLNSISTKHFWWDHTRMK